MKIGVAGTTTLPYSALGELLRIRLSWPLALCKRYSAWPLSAVGNADWRADGLSDCFDFNQNRLTFKAVPAKQTADWVRRSCKNDSPTF
jgi:hypothetical protein